MKLLEYIQYWAEDNAKRGAELKKDDVVAASFFSGQAIALEKLRKSIANGDIEDYK